ncbi:MAG: insulinase family protein [Clostridia bacterium]|nr:insulinase family protein [Clostridia bacterium]
MIEQTQLQNGTRVLMERMESVRSVALGVWVNAGSVFETDREAGISHFIEHMLFKGTERRSASDIAAEMDAIGANLNAFTAKECTCFHVKALDEDLEKAVDMLSDIVLFSTLDPEQMEREKGVVIEEIAMTEDSPEDIVFDRAGEQLFCGTALESEILGTEQTVRKLTREDLRRYMKKHYTSENTVIAVAGSFERDALLSLLERSFSEMPRGQRHDVPAVSIRPGFRTALVKKDVEQINLCIAFPGEALGTDAYYAQAVLSNALGGSMSSRLFQRIREERGLAYSVYSYPMAYRGTGSLCFYAGCTEGQAEEALSLMLREIDDVKRNGIPEDEFIRARQQLKGSYLLGMESTMAHMSALGKTALLLQKEYDLEATLNRIECVTIEAVKETAKRLFTPSAAVFCAVGRIDGVGDRLKTAAENWWKENGRQA